LLLPLYCSAQTAAPAIGTPAPAARVEPAPTAPSASGEPMFTGRYRVGPAEAPIRIVMFTDYQCEDCYKIEQQLVQLYNARKDMSISIKHYPFCTDCNPEVKSTLHANACWAARAAEAAGVLWGPEGFWKMHAWLFDRKGGFETTEELESGIREMGYDPKGFIQVMTSPETEKAIKADAAEAKQLGLFFTPMIFINGVELRGWNTPNALIRAVDALAAVNPPARSAAHDRPSRAFEKYIADWREAPLVNLPADKKPWALGPDDAKVKVVVWGDYQEPYCTQADAIIRAFAARRDDVQYTYRHYPFNSDCNSQVSNRRFPNACRAALAAEAAGRLGGNDGYWKMHAWLMENREKFDDATLRPAATEMGFDADALFAAMEQPELQASILDDIQAAKQLPQLRYGVRPGL
jgi:protein-disulfide isomerase